MVEEEIQNLKNGNAIGPDELHREVLRTLLRDKDMLMAMTKFFNKIYDAGVLPQGWFKSNLCDTSKKAKLE